MRILKAACIAAAAAIVACSLAVSEQEQAQTGSGSGSSDPCTNVISSGYGSATNTCLLTYDDIDIGEPPAGTTDVASWQTSMMNGFCYYVGSVCIQELQTGDFCVYKSSSANNSSENLYKITCLCNCTWQVPDLPKLASGVQGGRGIAYGGPAK